jgi:uncharacterized tellurite resistance protein B-like protein
MQQKAAESVEELKVTLRHWQDLEDKTIEQTAAIAQKTQNPLIKLIMEIIRKDSTMHLRVQQAMLDGLEKEAFTLTPEELADVWDLIEKHAEMEKQTIALAEKARRNCRLFVHRHLLTYLIEDEQKQTASWVNWRIRRGIYPLR